MTLRASSRGHARQNLGCLGVSLARRAATRGFGLIALCMVSTGCVSSSQLVPPQPSAITQLLVIRALERALVQLDTTRLAGRSVAVDVFTQIGNQPWSQAFVKEFVVARLQARGVKVSDSAELSLKIFASALGTDRGETFVGIPSIQIPLFGVPTPEIAVFKWVRNRGLAELFVYAFDGKTNAFVDSLAPGVGRSKQDDFTVLIVINFTLSDVQPPSSPTR